MTHEDILNALPAFALGALDREERDEVAAHVSGCATCTAELDVLNGVIMTVGLDEPPVTPPPHLKARVLARVSAQSSPSTASAPSRSPQWGWLAIAASVAVAILSSVYAFGLRSEVASLRSEIAASSSQASRLREELASLRKDWSTLTKTMNVIKAPDVLRVDLKGSGAAADATAHAYWSSGSGIVLTAGHLPALPEGRVYQLWTIVGSTPTGSVTFTPDASGAVSVTTPAAGAARPDAFGITIEPTGGSQAPTLPIVMVGSSK